MRCHVSQAIAVVMGSFVFLSAALAEHTRNIMFTGYWPPTNEMVRRFSTDPDQNPEGWIGDNWEGRGYDVYSFFPECDSHFPICVGDFMVDYQDTSADWWPITDEVQPVGIITYSRGSPNFTWELEMNQYNRSAWVPDYINPKQPTPSPPDDSVPAGTLRLSTLPVEAIADAVNEADLGIFAFVCYTLDGGGFLSEYMAYHGVWYQDIHKDAEDESQCVTAGHIHVGEFVPVEDGMLAVNVSLRELIAHIDSILGKPGDADGDLDVDLFDFSAFQDCVTGPGGEVDPSCDLFDFDRDFDVDAIDFAELQTLFTGSA